MEERPESAEVWCILCGEISPTRVKFSAGSAMKTRERRDAMGSTELAIFVVPRRSWGKIFCGKRQTGTQPQKSHTREGAGCLFCFCFSSLAEPVLAAARSGQGRAVFGARRKRTLEGEDRCERIDEGGKD
jgi:hypothetical protein